MIRLAWRSLLVVALGLVASLVPQVTYTSASSGEVAGDVLIAWPGWGVQQDLGPLSGTLGGFRIWVAAEPDRDDVTVRASLVDAATREVLRQTFIDATPSYLPVPRTLTFPSYVVPEGQRLLLQLQVQLPERFHVIYRLAPPQPELGNVMLNGAPDSGAGPLAFAHLETGSGLRAAVVGEPAARLRLVLAVVLSALAALAHPRVAAGLRRVGMAAQLRAQGPARRMRRLAGPRAEVGAGQSPTRLGRLLAVPWYPWPAAAIPILHFLTSNPLHFAPIEAVIPLAVAVVGVTGSVVGFRLLLKEWHRPAAATVAVTVVFFAYGHVERVLDGRVDDPVFFAGAAVLAAGAVAAVVRTRALAARGTQFLNLTATVLLAFPVASLAGGIAASVGGSPASDSVAVEDLAAHLLPSGLTTASGERPDIYYIILDQYARAEGLGEFDNSGFVRELERRGFYVASEATSNYTSSMQSIPSTLNMSYLGDLGQRTPAKRDDLIRISHNHALGAILKHLGYKYIHLESGYILTEEAPLADIVVRFTPAGTIVSGGSEGSRVSNANSDELLRLGGFLPRLLQTTAMRPIVGNRFLIGDDAPFDWWSPYRTLRVFEYLTGPIETDGPKFVFAHIVKPHGPANFDRFGNFLASGSRTESFDEFHDSSVPEAYIGQLIYINSLVIKMLDAILQRHSDPPIIVIAGDHGRTIYGSTGHPILAAFHLPNGGSDALYASISSVNHFRAGILDFYFGAGVGLLEDVKFSDDGARTDFRPGAGGDTT